MNGLTRSVASMAAAGLILMAITTGCGRRGAPRPPEDVLPATIADLAARNVDSGILLTWSRPNRYVDGSSMVDLGHFSIDRSPGPLGGPDFGEIARIEVEDRDRFRQVKSFRFVDRSVAPGASYRYQVTSRTTDGYVGSPSNQVSIDRVGKD